MGLANCSLSSFGAKIKKGLSRPRFWRHVPKGLLDTTEQRQIDNGVVIVLLLSEYVTSIF